MNENIKIFTIGFTQKNAKSFFSLIKNAGVTKVIDTRLNNVSQLAGFAKKDDLSFFLESLCNIEYKHQKELAPTQDLLDEYKKGDKNWNSYEQKFIKLIESRKIEHSLSPEALNGSCLLCSEHLPHHCHRRLVAEYLKEKWRNVEIIHLK